MSRLSFKRYQPVGLRIWHWLNAVIVTGLVLTIFMRQLFFRIRANAQLIQAKAQAAGSTITPQTAKDIAETMTDHFWQ